MISRRQAFLESIKFIVDLAIVSLCWVAAYIIMFYWHLFKRIVPVTKGTPPLDRYSFLIIFILLIWGVMFRTSGLYRGGRVRSFVGEAAAVLRSNLMATVFFIIACFFAMEVKPSRVVFVVFWGISSAGLLAWRAAFRLLVRYLSGKEVFGKRSIVAGTGPLAREFIRRAKQYEHLGVKVIGLLSDNPDEVGRTIMGIPVLGTSDEVQKIVEQTKADEVVVALPMEAPDRITTILKNLSDEMVDLKVIPDVTRFCSLRLAVENFEGL
ncbi:MAG TPA: hypothetical protein ENF73_06760, partial [Proteobacteria bacterium]|nr:hypothetical protein [Pseudomonadota bacterium]